MKWFWVITVQWNNSLGTTANTVNGFLSAEQASRLQTRTAAFTSVLASARRHLGIPDGMATSVLFYSLEPDTLAGAR